LRGSRGGDAWVAGNIAKTVQRMAPVGEIFDRLIDENAAVMYNDFRQLVAGVGGMMIDNAAPVAAESEMAGDDAV
jgi:hypothetical protein